jgi:hypothetical protein
MAPDTDEGNMEAWSLAFWDRQHRHYTLYARTYDIPTKAKRFVLGVEHRGFADGNIALSAFGIRVSSCFLTYLLPLVAIMSYIAV